MGTHPKSPAMLYGTSTTLSDYLARNIDQLGDAKRFSPPFPENKEEKVGGEGHVPFLFKILTCKQGARQSSPPFHELWLQRERCSC